VSRLPDRVSILRFWHLLERHQLAGQFLKTVIEQLSAKDFMVRGCPLVLPWRPVGRGAAGRRQKQVLQRQL
jgi:IS5 family transposase